MQGRFGIVELAERNSDGLLVRLLFNFDADECVVEVDDTKQGNSFTLYPHNSQALDCFHHPYAYAASALKTGRMERQAA